jgi:hypothetical protein
LAHVPIWPAGLLRVQGACRSWSEGLALRRRPTPQPALLLAASCCALRSRRRRGYLPHHHSQGQARACACQACCRLPPSISAKTQSRSCTATQHKETKIQQRDKIESKSNARRARGGWGLHSRRIPVQKLNPPWEIPNPRQVEKREGERTTQDWTGTPFPSCARGKKKQAGERKGVRGFLTPTTLIQKDYITPRLK